MDVQGDLGAEVVTEVKERREFRDDGIRERERGFVCDPLGVTQEIWSDLAVYDRGAPPAWRVHVRTHVLKGFEATRPQLRALSSEMSKPSLSAVVRDAEVPTRLQLAASLYVNAANREWAPQLLGLVAGQQLAGARSLGRAPALSDPGVGVDVTEGDTSTVQSERTTSRFETLCDADPYDVVDMTQMVAVLKNVWRLHAVRTPRGVTAAVPHSDPTWGDVSALIEIEAKSHGRLGLGLLVSSTVPGRADMSDALALAETELEAGCPTDLLGSWFVTRGILTHRSFFPVFVATKPVALHAATSAARRALWLSHRRGQPSSDGPDMEPLIRRVLNLSTDRRSEPDDDTD